MGGRGRKTVFFEQKCRFEFGAIWHIDICRVEIDARTALWVWASTHPSFCNGAEIYPIVFPPFSLCSNPPPPLFDHQQGRWKPAAVFTPLEGRLDWPITACTHCDMNKLLPKKLVLLLYMDIVYWIFYRWRIDTIATGICVLLRRPIRNTYLRRKKSKIAILRWWIHYLLK
jgi:hypothetical protein